MRDDPGPVSSTTDAPVAVSSELRKEWVAPTIKDASVKTSTAKSAYIFETPFSKNGS